MIKATDVRIGNLLFDKGADALFCAVIVKAIDEHGFVWVEDASYSWGHKKVVDAEPIQLTPEWLERCGFQKKTNEMQINCIEMTYHIDDSTYFSSCGGLNGSLAVLCLCRGNYFANNLQYLHQLQNLYYALTGKELAITQPVT